MLRFIAGNVLGSPPPGDPRWGYDDPSGVPETVAVTVRVPEPLLDSIQVEAARRGVTPTAWLLDLADRSLRTAGPAAA